MIVNQSAAAAAFRVPPYLRPAIYAHAIETYPEEACGVIFAKDDGVLAYRRSDNIAPEEMREDMFTLDPGVYEPVREDGSLVAIVHTHTKGQCCPSRADMEAQLLTGVPWVIVVMDGPERIIEEFSFPIPLGAPVTGVEFRPGVADCVETLRRFYWQEYGVELPPTPRDDQWWHQEEGTVGSNLFLDLYKAQGFRQLAPEEIRDEPEDPASPIRLQRGDVGLVRVMSPNRINHCVIYTGGQMMTHHLLMRVSEEAPVSRWLPRIEIWLRHTSQDTAHEDDPSLRSPQG